MKFPVLKEILSRLGVFVSPRIVHYLNGFLNYLSVGRWFHDRKIAIPIRCAGRAELYQFVAKQVREPATYLEFGVLEGATLRQWIQLLKSPESRFTGFDSFEGLPENWGLFTSKEVFDVKGRMPQFDDPRVRLVKGWFRDTLPSFLREFYPNPTLILHLDADLYSSTIFVLRQMKPYLQPGTILIFDEFFDREHELKALNELLNDEKLKLRCLAATRELSQAAFELLPAGARTMKPRVLMIAYACNPEGSGEHWLGWGWAAEAAKNYSVDLLTTTNHRAQIEKQSPRHDIKPHFVSLPDGLRNVSERLGGVGRWLRKIVWQSRAAKLANTLHAREKFQLVHQTTFHTFRVPFLASRLDIPSVWGPVAGGESVPPGFGRELGAARLGEMGRRLGNRLWLMFPPVRRSLARAGVIFVSNRTTLEFLPEAVRAKCVIVPPNALRPEDETLHRSSSSSNGGGRIEGEEEDEDENENENEGENEKNEEEDDGDSLFHLLYVGNCVATRALPLVFEALRHSGLKDVRLTIVGSGPALARWRRLVEKFGLVASVEFTGQVARDQLPALYERADALVFPALRDSGGSALLEAMARGVPVICLDWGGPGEMVDANSGVKIPVRYHAETVAGLAAAIARLQALPALRLALARAARERALAQFRWEAKARVLNTTYQRLLAAS